MVFDYSNLHTWSSVEPNKIWIKWIELFWLRQFLMYLCLNLFKENQICIQLLWNGEMFKDLIKRQLIWNHLTYCHIGIHVKNVESVIVQWAIWIFIWNIQYFFPFMMDSFCFYTKVSDTNFNNFSHWKCIGIITWILTVVAGNGKTELLSDTVCAIARHSYIIFLENQKFLIEYFLFCNLKNIWCKNKLKACL